MLDPLKKYGRVLGKGLLLQVTPGIVSGVIVELFRQWKTDVGKVTRDVQENRSLTMTPEQQTQVKKATARIGSLDFITTDFVIESIKKDFPAVASLFLSWPEARDWLTRQIEDLKKQAGY